jgi:glycosyltransferase involved in cell wall biosynthesis
MQFKDFKKEYLKKTVVEYQNNRKGKQSILTVKVVTYNHINYIEQCLESILMQNTNFDFEILIAEDDSNDGTREICKQYADKYPNKIRLLLNSRENNIAIDSRPTGTFNSIYANYSINSKYIAMLEGDDYWTDTFSLQKRVDFLEANNDFVLCFHNAIIYYQNSAKFHSKLMVPCKKDTTIKKQDILNFSIPTLTLLFRNGLIDVFDKNMLNVSSGDTILRAKLSNFGKAKYLQSIKPSVYRIHNKGIYSGGNLEQNKKDSLNARGYLLNHFKEKKWDIAPITKSFAITYFMFFIAYLKKENKIKFQYLLKSIAYATKANTPIYKIIKEFLLSNKARKIKI